MRVLLLPFLLLLAFTTFGCGSEATDRPQDCSNDQYYNEARRLCQTCPAVQEPTCRPGCGVEVMPDPRGCPVMTCDELCPGCDSDQQWNSEEEQCVDVNEDESANQETDA